MLVEDPQMGERFNLKLSPSYDYRPNYNVAPGQYAPVITPAGLEHMHWGLVPRRVKDSGRLGSTMINVRAETVVEKPTYRRLLERHRCLVPANGFYEWLKVDGPRAKVPYYFKLGSGKYMAFAGLYEVRKDAEGQDVKSFTIITTEANELVAKVHDRMPVILLHETEEIWLDPNVTEPAEVLPLLRPYPAIAMAGYEVGPAVGSRRNNGPELIKPVT